MQSTKRSYSTDGHFEAKRYGCYVSYAIRYEAASPTKLKLGIRHITTSAFHPRTNGKIERYHRIIKGEINQLPYDMPSELKEASRAFIEYYDYWRYHEGLGNVTPYDVYTGKHLEIIRGRKEVKSRALEVRRDYNRTARKQGHSL